MNEYWTLVGWYWREKTEETGAKYTSILVPLCAPQISQKPEPQSLCWEDWQRTALNVARPIQSKYTYTYTGCPTSQGHYFGRVFLMLKYTDITQNTYVKSWTVTEIMAGEKCWHLAFPRTVRLQLSAHWPWQSNAVGISVVHKLRPTR